MSLQICTGVLSDDKSLVPVCKIIALQTWLICLVKPEQGQCIKLTFLKMLNISFSLSLRKKCPNTKFFLFRIFPYSVRMRENTDQKKLRIRTLFKQCVIQLIKKEKINKNA